MKGHQTMAHGLFLYGLQTKNGFYVFKKLKKKSHKIIMIFCENYVKIFNFVKIQIFKSVKFYCKTFSFIHS